MAAITLERIGKTFPGGTAAVRDVSLSIADGEQIVLVGPSGCGKSTVLRIIAGLEEPTAGRVLFGGVDVTREPPQARDLAMVFQSYALYPHLSVRGNLSFGLRVRGTPADEIARRVHSAAATLGLEPLLDRRPAQLSGGQRQRVALGRALVRKPRAFLFDEPLSNLDPRLRSDTRAELSLLLKRLGATMIYVTHDQEEAMTLGARIAVMREGAVVQTGPPLEVFRRPADAFVAGFLGSPAMNLLDATVGDEGGRVIRCGRLAVAAGEAVSRAGARDVLLGIRPHDVELTAAEEADVSGRIELVEPLGGVTVVHLRTAVADAPLFRAVVPPDTPVAAGREAGFRIRRDRLHVFDRQTGVRLA